MLYNLMTNAIKFTRKGRIVVSGHIKPKEKSPSELVLTVSVADEGIGISNEDIVKVFDGL